MSEEIQDEELLFLLKRINIDQEVYLERKLKEKNMSGVQIYFLVYILRHHPGGTYITELCREIGISKATLSVLVKKLREKGYLYFGENPEDIRKKMVLPTEKLVAEGNEFVNKAEQMEKEIYCVLDPQEKGQLREVAQKILTQLGKMEKRKENHSQTEDRREVTV